MPSHANKSTAVILAAGMGTRLSGCHEGPKGLLELSGEKLVPRSLRLLADVAGLSDFVIVVGWRGEDYRTALRQSGHPVRFVENRAFAATGSLRSLALASREVAGDAWVLESDLLFERRALAALRAAPSPDTVLASGPTSNGDEVRVYADESGKLEHLSKQAVPAKSSVGELVGISRISHALMEALAAAQDALPATASYEDAFNAVCRTHPTSILKIEDLAWTEIDDPSQLQRARSTVWPRIQAMEEKSA